ncbi:MAG: hypothetical protein OXC46_02035 [Thaumarchaeota archaeon]|nr:hypothetical protein [Nitrososphaerota archaeon]
MCDVFIRKAYSGLEFAGNSCILSLHVVGTMPDKMADTMAGTVVDTVTGRLHMYVMILDSLIEWVKINISAIYPKYNVTSCVVSEGICRHVVLPEETP